MSPTISAIQIGLDPDLIDVDSPDFAQFPGLSAERLRAAHEANLAGLRERGVGPKATPDDLLRWFPDAFD